MPRNSKIKLLKTSGKEKNLKALRNKRQGKYSNFFLKYTDLKKKINKNFWNKWRVADHATPKYATWHKDYFEPNAVEKKQIQEKLSVIPYLLTSQC